MNDLLEAAESGDDSSSERYEKVKKEEAGTVDVDPARKRYQELKEKAKEELKRKHEETGEPSEPGEHHEQEENREDGQGGGTLEETVETGASDKNSFITH
ncbi:MAG: hypothetical protein ABEJ93_02340 [Candidatus Nanohalobium sp.]